MLQKAAVRPKIEGAFKAHLALIDVTWPSLLQHYGFKMSHASHCSLSSENYDSVQDSLDQASDRSRPTAMAEERVKHHVELWNPSKAVRQISPDFI